MTSIAGTVSESIAGTTYSIQGPENYIFSDGYLGIPIYVSIKNEHLSMEHTHPPHLYIWGNDKFEKVGKIKKEINEIIYKKTSKI